MKKVFAAIPGVLAALHLLVPLVFLISVLNGGYLELYHPVFIAVISSVTSVAAVIVMLVFGERYGKWNGAALAATLLFDAVTQFYFTYHAVNVINGYDTAAPAIIALFGTVATLVMFVKCVEDSVFKAVIGVLSVLFSIVAAGIAIYALINTLAFGRTFYADGPDSPDGRYSVKITYRESGLISDGKSYVVLTDNNESGAFVGAIKRKPFDRVVRRRYGRYQWRSLFSRDRRKDPARIRTLYRRESARIRRSRGKRFECGVFARGNRFRRIT